MSPPHEPVDVDQVIHKASKVHKLVGVDRETFLDINQLHAQLNLTYTETIKFLVLYSGLDYKSDLRKDLKVRQIMQKMGRAIPQ